MLHVHPLLGNGLVDKFQRRQILGKQSVARLRNNSDYRRSVFNVVRAMPSARQQNCKHVYNNRSCFLCVIRAEVYKGQQRSFASSRSWEAVSQGHDAVMEKSWEYKDENGVCP
jgi:hypothetical protein